MQTRFQDLSAFKVPLGFRGRNVFVVQLWWLVQGSFFRFSPKVFYGFRRWLLRVFGAQVGKGVIIRSSAQITYPWFLSVGDYSWIGDETVIYNLAPISIGNNVALAHRVYLCTGLHHIDRLDFMIGAEPIRIEDEAWLANDCFISPGVTIGRGAVIGARSTVLRDMPEGMVCVGYPCKPIRPRLPGAMLDDQF